jgi:hypothetical protein
MKPLGILFLLCFPVFAAENVLIVADEIPAMEVLAAHLSSGAGVTSTIVKQTEMPADLGAYSAVIVYIHKTMGEPAERAFIDYANSGGKLILLHHSISSGKRKNKYWFPFLGISLPVTDFSQGGYKWIEPVTLEIVNLAPRHYITTNSVKYDSRISYKDKEYPGFVLKDTEVYLNHVYSKPRTSLLGLKYTDAQSGMTYMQDSAGWIMKADKGTVIYFMPGHTEHEFENPIYGQILLNAVKYK